MLTSSGQDDTYMQPNLCAAEWMRQISSQVSPVLLNGMKDTDITHFPCAAEWHEGRRYHTFPHCCWMTWRTQILHISPVLLNDMKDTDSIIGFPCAAEGHTALQVSPVLLKDMKDTDIRDVTSSLPLNWSHAVCTLHTHTIHTDTHYLSLWWMSFVITLFGAVKPVTGSWVFSVLLSQIIMLTLVTEPPTHSFSWLENWKTSSDYILVCLMLLLFS